MALVAATTVGLAELQRVRAEVTVGQGDLPAEAPDEYRLVVQSYAAANVVDGVPQHGARPLASAQRSVTAEELSRGISVDVLGVGTSNGGSAVAEDAVIVAWVERGAPNLEFDGRRARPSPGAITGTAKARGDKPSARLVLRRSA